MPMWCTLVAPNCLDIYVSLLFPLPILRVDVEYAKACNKFKWGHVVCGCVCGWGEDGRECSALQERFCVGQGDACDNVAGGMLMLEVCEWK